MIESLSLNQKFENSKFKKRWIMYFLLAMEFLTNVPLLKSFNVCGKEFLKIELLMFMNSVDELLIEF